MVNRPKPAPSTHTFSHPVRFVRSIAYVRIDTDTDSSYPSLKH